MEKRVWNGPGKDLYVMVTYVTIEGGGGSVRKWLSELPVWLIERPGTLIVGLLIL